MRNARFQESCRRSQSSFNAINSMRNARADLALTALKQMRFNAINSMRNARKYLEKTKVDTESFNAINSMRNARAYDISDAQHRKFQRYQ